MNTLTNGHDAAFASQVSMGLTKREYFAIALMAAYVASDWAEPEECAVRAADKLLMELNKGGAR